MSATKGKGGRSALIQKETEEACKDKNVVKAAKEGLSSVDVLVCGTCLQVFHFIHEFHDHKKAIQCSKPKLNPAQFSTSSKIWAFMLWKNSPKTKKDFSKDVGDNVVMWKNWSDLDEATRRSWMTGGTVLWEAATVNQSNVDEISASQFDSAGKRKPRVTPVPLATLLQDPKLNVPTKVTLERVFIPESSVSKRPHTPDDPLSSKRAKTQVQLEETEESQEYVVEAIVGKKFDCKTMGYLFEIKWEGFPSSQNTWEPEENVTHCKSMIEEFERTQRNVNQVGRPMRSSKTKAMDKVKSWVNAKDTDSDLPTTKSTPHVYEPDLDIKIEERDPLDIDYDPGNDSSGGFDNAERSDTPASDVSSTEKSTPSKKTTPVKKNVNVTAKKQPVAKAATQAASKPPDPRTNTLLVANSLGMVRVNAKALPDIRSGIYSVSNNEQLSRIKPLVPKVKRAPNSGLVVITNNPLKEKPGVRRKPLTLITETNKTVNKVTTPLTKTITKPIPILSKPAAAAGVLLQQQQQPVATQQQQPDAASTATTPASTTFVLPPNPSNLPYLVMAPPGSGMSSLLITPDKATGDASKPTDTSDSEKTSSAKDTSKENTEDTIKDTDGGESADVSLAMEVSDGDTAAEIDRLINEITGDEPPELLNMSEDMEVEPAKSAEDATAEDKNSEKEDKTEEEDKDKSSAVIQNITEKESEIQKDADDTGSIDNSSNSASGDDESKSKDTEPSESEKTSDSSVEKIPPKQSAEPVESETVADCNKVTESSTVQNTVEVNAATQLMSPMLVEIPEGVDPSHMALPPNTQLMVADTGEYYLVPKQPQGSTVAIAQDPSSGEVKVIAMPAGGEDKGFVVLGDNNLQQQIVVDASNIDSGDDKFLMVTSDGQYVMYTNT